MSVQVQKHSFGGDEYYQMVQGGVFSEDNRVELIEGEGYEMRPIGNQHAECVNRLRRLLNLAASDFAIVAIQNPIRLNDFSEPQPELA